MTTVQELANGKHGHKVFPPLGSIESPTEATRADLPTNKANHNHPAASVERELGPFAANAYHVPPKHYAASSQPYQGNDCASRKIDTTPLPRRCQFMFSDGRQCTMARSDIHPSLCPFHSEREEQLFGEPSPAGLVRGASLDLPELHSACRDLTTAAGVNRALAQVFRLLAQRRISRQEAATFGHLAQLLLRTISAARAEHIAAAQAEYLAASSTVIPSEQRERGISPASPSVNKVVYPTSPPRNGHPQDALFAGNKVELRGAHEVALSPPNKDERESRDLSAPQPPVDTVEADERTSVPSSPNRNSYIRRGARGGAYNQPGKGIESNSHIMNTYEIAGDNPI